MLGGVFVVIAMGFLAAAWWPTWQQSTDRKAWALPALAMIHLLASLASLYVNRGPCGGGPLPYTLEHLYLRYMSATRALPLLFFLVVGAAGSVPPRFRQPGLATFAMAVLWLAESVVLDYAPLDCGILE